MHKHLPKVASFGVEELVDGQVQVDGELEGVVIYQGGGHGLEGVGVPMGGREGGGEGQSKGELLKREMNLQAWWKERKKTGATYQHSRMSQNQG